MLIHRILEVAGGAPAAAAAAPSPPPSLRTAPAAATPLQQGGPAFELLAVGASTGGPVAIQRLLVDLGPELPVPVVVAQHMPPGFTGAFADRLHGRLSLSVREAADGEILLPSAVYIAPAGCHLRIGRRGARFQARVAAVAAEHSSHRPSIDILFSSVARAAGGAALAVLLTGMGRDGAQGMSEVARAGGYTVAQDERSSVVWGMPRAAAELGAVVEMLPLDDIGPRLRQLLGGSLAVPARGPDA